MKYELYDGQGNVIHTEDIDVPRERADILQELEEIDRKSIRAIREGNTGKIEEWEQKAQALREELAAL